MPVSLTKQPHTNVFQKKKKKVIYETPWGDIPYLEYKKKVEFEEEEYKEINRYIYDNSKNIIWFASPWDLPSVDFLERFNIPCYKIASAKLTDRELLEKISKLNKPIFLSVGMSTEEEIEKAINILNDNELVLLHCNSCYPDTDLNLNYIRKLKTKYPDHIIGYSGHEYGITASIIAAQIGAKVIERHITLDRAMWGSDQAASLEFSGLRRLVRDLRKITLWEGDGIKKVTKGEIVVRDKLRNINTL